MLPDRRSCIILLVVTLFALVSPLSWGQSNIPAETTNWLQQTTPIGSGSTDLFSVIFFEVPADAVDVDDFIYIGVNDAGSDGVSPDQNTGTTDYYLFGGTGALTDSTSRQRVFASLSQASAGRQLGMFSADGTAAYNIEGGETSNWTYFSGVKLSDGEQIGSKVYFKVVVDALTNGGNYKNAFQLDISRLSSGVPTQITGVRSFAYSWPIYNAETADATLDWTIYPFVSNSMDTEDLGIHGWDFDGTGNTADLYTKSNALVINNASFDGGATNYPDDATEDYWTITTAETNGYWRLELTEGSGSGFRDGAEVFFSLDNGTTAAAFDVNDGVVRAYAKDSVLTAPDYVAVTTEDGIAVDDGIDVETVTLQIVDSSGTPLPYAMSITVNVDGSATIDYVNGAGVASAQSQLVNTDSDGLATIGVVDNSTEIINVTVNVFSSANETAVISFEADPEPTLVTSGITSMDPSTTVTLPRVTITETGGSTVIMKTPGTETLQIRIPAGLDATFVGGALDFVIGGGTITDSSYTNPAGGTILTIEPTATFAAGDTMTIDGIQITAGATASTGYLELSYDNGGSWNVVDVAEIRIITALTNSYVWTGAAGTTQFNDNANWSPVGIPGGTDSAYIPASPTLPVFPNLTFGAGVSPTVAQLILESGASFTIGDETLTVNEGLFVDGTLTAGTGSLSVGGDTLGSGTITAGSGNITFSGDLQVDTYTATSGTTYIGGDFSPTTFTHSSGTVEFNGTGAQTVTSGGNNFDTVVLNKVGGSIAFNDALIIASGLSVGAGVAFDLSFNTDTGGQTSSIAGNTTLSNTGTITFGSAAGDSITFTGGLTSTAGTKSLTGSLLSEGGVIDLDTTALTLTGTTAIDATSNGNPAGANITIASITGGYDLTVNGGTGGTVISTGTWGAAVDLASLNLDAAGFTQGGTVEASGLVDISVSAGIALNYLVVSSGGDVNITSSGGSITDGSGAETALVSGATISLNAVSGAIGAAAAGDVEVTATTVINADTSTAGGDIYLSTTTAMPLGVIDAGTGSVILDSAGAVTDADGTADISGSVGTITAAGAVSADTDLTSLSVTTSAAGAIDISEADNITLTLVQANSGTIDIVSVAGNITVTDINDVSTISRVTLNASGSIDDGAAATEVISTQDLRLTAGSGITDLNVDVSNLAAETDTGNLTLIADNALTITTVDTVSGITIIDSGAADAGADISIQSGGTVTLSQPVVNNDAGDITCTASTGNIVDNTGGETALFSGATVSLNAVSGAIGGAAALDIEVTATTAFNADTTAGTAIYIESIGDLPVGLVAANTAVYITSSGQIDEETATGDAADDITGTIISLTADTAAGGIGITAVPEISASSYIDIDTTANNMNASISSTGNIIIGTMDAGSGTLTLAAAAGSINDDAAGATDVTAGTVNFDAANGIGNSSQIQMSSVTSAAADNTGAFAVNISNDVADLGVSITSLTTVGSTINFVQTGQSSTTLSIDGSVTSGGVPNGGNITISAENGISVNQPIDTNAGSGGTLTMAGITLSAVPVLGAGSIGLDGNSNSTYTDSITLGSLTFGSDIYIICPEDIIVAGVLQNTAGYITLEADGDNNGTGGVQVQAAGRVISDTSTITLQGSDLSVDAGTIVIEVADASNALDQISAAGLITLSTKAAAASDGSISISDAMQSSSGGLTISAEGDIDFSANAVLVVSGDVSVTADNEGGNDGAINTASGSSIDAGAGDISLSAYGNIQVGSLTTTSALAAAVAIDSSAGSILDINGAAVNITATGTLTLSAANDIGDISGGTGDVTGASTDALETAVGTLSATATNAGSEIAVDNTGTALAVSVLNPGNASTGYARITNDLAIDVNGLTIGNGDNLGLVSSAGTLELPDAAISTTGTLYFSASGDISDNTDTLLSNNTWAAGTLYFYGGVAETLSTDITNLTASMSGTAALTVTEADDLSLTSVITNDGNIDITSTAGNITVVSVTDTAASNTITLTASSGSVIDGGATDVTGNILDITAANGIGSGNALETSVVSLDLTNTTTGNVEILETDAVSVTQAVISAGGGNVSIVTTDGTLTTTGPVSTTVAGTVTLQNGDAGASNDDDLLIQGTVTSISGKITLTSATDDVVFIGGGDITSTSGEIEVNAGAAGVGLITLADGTILNAGSGIIDLNGVGTVTLGQLITTSASIAAGSEAVNIVSTAGAVVDAGDTGGDDIQAVGRLVVDAATGIGSGAALETAVGSADLDTTISGNIEILEADDISLTSVVTNNGNIDITSTAGNITVVSVTDTAASNTITLTASAGSVIDGGATDVTGNILDITAANGIGSGNALETSVVSLDLTNTTTGSIEILEVDAVSVTQAVISAGGGNVSIVTTDGTLTTTGPVSTTVAGTVTLQNGDAGASNDDDLLIQGTVTSISGKITLTSATDDVVFTAAGDVASTSGEIEVNAGAAGTGLITLADGTVLNAGSGIIDLNGAGTVTLGQLITTSASIAAGSEAVNIVSTAGAVVDAGDTGGEDIQAAGRLVIDAVTGIGSGAALETAVGSVDLDNTSSGNIEIGETDAITLINIDQGGAAADTVTVTAGGDITVDSGGSGITAVDGTVTVNAGANTIYLDNDITTNGGDILIQSVAELGASVTVSTNAGAAGDITFSGAINDDGGNRDLILTSGTGDITVTGIIGAGAGNDIGTLFITGNDVTLNGVGSGANTGADIVNVTANDNLPDGARITLQGAGNYYTSGTQTYTSGNQAGAAPDVGGGVVYAVTADSIFQAGGSGITLDELYFDFNSAFTVTVGSGVSCQRMVCYQGDLDLNGITVDSSGDIVLYGSSYSSNDPDRNTNFAGNTFFTYPNEASLLYYPGAGNPAAVTAANLDTQFSDLTGTVLDVSAGNFYVNGTDMNAGAWILNNRTQASVAGLDYDTPSGWPFGAVYAAAFNMTVANSTANFPVAASSIGTSQADNHAGEQNNAVVDGTGNTNWDFSRPYIVSVQTVRDDTIYITFSEAIENSSNEIANAVSFAAGDVDTGALWMTNGTVIYSGAFTDEACTTSVAGQGDLTSFYIQASDSWNSDAAANSAGGASSTDWAGTAKTNVPDLRFLKGLLYDAVGHNTVRSYSVTDGFTEYASATDQCEPALVAVYADQDNGSGDNRDYHNYFRVLYSEPVNIGDLTIGGFSDTNIQGEASFTNAAEHGGNISGTGTVTVAGYFSYPGTLNTLSRTADTQVTAISRTAGSDHEIYFYVAGYDDGNAYTYPGMIQSGATNPATTAVTRIANTYITDASANVYDNTVGSALTISQDPADDAEPDASLSVWDITGPEIGPFPDSTTPTANEIIVRDSGGNTIIETIEMHFLDDAGSIWDSATDHIDGVNGTPSEPWKGIRDDTVEVSLGSFYLDNTASGASVALPAPLFSTTVNDTTLFGAVANSAGDDPYFSVSFDEDYGFTELDQLYLTYDPGSAAENITDLAGNIMASFTNALCLERTPPRILYSLAVAGDDKIYLKFSEPVYQTAGTAVTVDPILPTDFTFTPAAAYTISSVEVLTTDLGGAKELYLHLGSGVSMENIANFPIYGYAMTTNLVDQFDNQASTSDVRLSSLGIGIAVPVWASDSIHQDVNYGTNFSTVRDFDGSGKIMDADITLEARILPTIAAGDDMTLIYDVDPAAATLTGPGNLWLPTVITEYNSYPNDDVRELSAFGGVDPLRDYFIADGDSEIVAGADLEFIFKLGSLYCVRSLDSEDPRRIAPWILPVQDINRQTGGVTILGNVINPGDGDETVLSYQLSQSGMVTITVFGLDGDVVNTIQRGHQAAGEHRATWDGRNRGGRVVARGIYFIRIVAPEIDEYRKVMVVK